MAMDESVSENLFLCKYNIYRYLRRVSQNNFRIISLSQVINDFICLPVLSLNADYNNISGNLALCNQGHALKTARPGAGPAPLLLLGLHVSLHGNRYRELGLRIGLALVIHL
jgi:hypothetical protein